MPQHPVELNNVIYNPATQAFEARAVVHDPSGSRSYACAVKAPITTEFDRASTRLTTQALERHDSGARWTDMPQAKVGYHSGPEVPFAA